MQLEKPQQKPQQEMEALTLDAGAELQALEVIYLFLVPFGSKNIFANTHASVLLVKMYCMPIELLNYKKNDPKIDEIADAPQNMNVV